MCDTGPSIREVWVCNGADKLLNHLWLKTTWLGDKIRKKLAKAEEWAHLDCTVMNYTSHNPLLKGSFNEIQQTV